MCCFLVVLSDDIIICTALLLLDIECQRTFAPPSHPATDSQFFRFSVNIFSWSARAGGGGGGVPEKNFEAGHDSALAGPA
jgi:hypothetical protein